MRSSLRIGRRPRQLALFVLILICAGIAWPDELQKPEPGKKIHVFLFAGQSNMEGRADGRSLTDMDRKRLENAQTRIQFAFNREPVRPLDVVEPSEEIREIYQIDRLFGPELFFGLALAEAWPGERMLFIKRTAGGTSLYGCWNPDWSEVKAAVMEEEKEPKLYDEFTAYVKQVLSGYAPADYEIRAMLWVQGESDSHTAAAAEAYGDNLRNLISRVRVDLGPETLPFLLLQVGKGKVVEGMQQTAQAVAKVSLIPQNQAPDSP
ncbi:MAG: hypothetical protein HYV26_00920, partial [Candidatus Hydrogenedentes bacterium]|nr:hypothetical protein [Candidatus Hydrogenedentota bacterium]